MELQELLELGDRLSPGLVCAGDVASEGFANAIEKNSCDH